jgi:hypothetical protein
MAKNKDQKRDKTGSEADSRRQGGYTAGYGEGITSQQNRENPQAENKNKQKGMK